MAQRSVRAPEQVVPTSTAALVRGSTIVPVVVERLRRRIDRAAGNGVVLVGVPDDALAGGAGQRIRVDVLRVRDAPLVAPREGGAVVPDRRAVRRSGWRG